MSVSPSASSQSPALSSTYYQSPDFRSLAASTQVHRRRIIDAFRRQHGTKPLKGLRREHIVQIMADKAETPEAANNLIKLLRVMLNYRSTNNKFLVAQLQQGFAASETGSRDGFAVQNSWALHVH